MDERKDFFISYNKSDRPWAEWIAWQLEVAGYTTVVQAWDFRPGSNFVMKMQKAAVAAERTIAVLSPDYLDALYTQPKWAAAFAQDPTGRQGTLVPVRVRECDLKGLLPQIIYIDLVGHTDEKSARGELLDGVSRERAKPDVPPGFPGVAKPTIPEKPGFPGTLPPIWNVPHRRNPNFTGRGSLLRSLRAALTSGQHAAVTQAISGLGGVGKTQLATEYAYRHASDYEVVWWVRSEESATLLSDYAALAGALDLPQKGEADLRVVAQAVRLRLERSGGWLLIFDNAGEASQVREYLPRGATGHVVITSRNPVWGGIASPLPVHVFDRDESVKFLLARTGQSDETAAGELADAVGDLPLALEQAAAYIEAAGQSISGYVEMFRERQSELLAGGDTPEGYDFIVATTWNISFQHLEEESGEAAALLRLVSFLAPDDIPRGLLTEHSDRLPEPLRAALADPLAFDKALAALRRYSLADVEGKELAIHRLVQAAVRERLAEGERKEWAGAAVTLMDAAFPYEEDEVETWAGSGRLLAHALAAAGHSEPLGVTPEATASLLNEVGSYLLTRANFAEAASSFRRALTIGDNVFGPDDPRVATIVNNLGYILGKQGDLAGARGHYERALRIDEAAYGPDHPKVATRVNNLGDVLQEQGDLTGARAHFERTLRIDETTYGPDHPDVARDVNNLGSVLQAEGDLAGERAHFERALRIDEKAYGPDHPTMATKVNNLGEVLRHQGILAGARTHFERALRIDEKAYSPEHPAVAIDVNNLGLVLQAEGDLAGARAHFERALRIFREFLGDDHPTTKLVEENLRVLGQ